MITDKGMHEIKKTNTRQEVERILPAEIFVTQFHAGCTAYFGLLLFFKFVLLSFQSTPYIVNAKIYNLYLFIQTQNLQKSCSKVFIFLFFLIKFNIIFLIYAFYEHDKHSCLLKDIKIIFAIYIMYALMRAHQSFLKIPSVLVSNH